MKDHEIAALVNDLTAEVQKLSLKIPHQLRLVISCVVRAHLDKLTNTPAKDKANG